MMRRLMRLSKSLGVRVLITLAAVALALVRFPAAWIESYYSTGLYPRLTGILQPMAELSPVSILDILLVAVAVGLPAWWIFCIRRAAAGARWAGAGRAAVGTLTLAALLVCGFELLWGLNYQRQPLSAKLEWDAKRVTPEAAVALARNTIQRLNAEASVARSQAMSRDWRAGLERSFRQVVTELGGPADFHGVAPRNSLVVPLLAAEGCEGFVNPFGYEVILDDETLTFEKPFLLAHEWAHLAGFADESEANFIGILTCLRSDQAMLRYSGLLNLSFYLPRRSPAAPLPELAPQVVSDIKAIDERVRKHYQPMVGNMQSRIYNQFLKVNRVRAGIASYGLVAQLMVGTRFETNWTPIMRGTADAVTTRAIAGDE